MEHPETPECERLSKITDQSQQLGEFLNWLSSQGLHLARWVEHGECDHIHDTGCPDPSTHKLIEPHLAPSPLSIERILALYFKIDLAKVESEKVAVLTWIRNRQEAAWQGVPE